jgi:hypothetical protein
MTAPATAPSAALNPAAAWPFPTGSRPSPGTDRECGGGASPAPGL